MRARYPLCLITAAALAAPACVEPEAPAASAVEADLTTPEEIVAALDLLAELNPTVLALVSPHPEAALARTNLGIITPRRGPSFLMLSTGRSGNDTLTAEPGTDFPPVGVEGDVVTLQVRVNVPTHANRLSFDYTFLTSEAPEYLGSPFTDTFNARITDTLGAGRLIASASGFSSTLHPASHSNVGDSPFLLYVDDPAGVDTVFNTGSQLDAGTTGFRRVDAQIASDGQVTLHFDIRDLGDGLLDSAVIIDNVAFSAVEIVDPNPDLINDAGQVSRDPAQLATQGRPITAVAADGVTQVLLRSEVPGPGMAMFALPSGASTNGALSAHEGPFIWGSSAFVETVHTGGKYYVFALYRSPPDFSLTGGGDPTRQRTAHLSMSYTSAAGGDFVQDFTIEVVRPPVVVVPELWTSCPSWADFGGIMDPGAPPGSPAAALTVTCADYAETSSRGLVYNAGVLPAYIQQALGELRGAGAAATQVDVVGHGMGGLLARRHIDALDYARPHNFNQGDLHRLITMNTPHLGARLADELVRMREFTKQQAPITWPQVKATLASAGIRIDDEDGDLAIDEMTTDSPVIHAIGTDTAPPRDVPHHALITSGGRGISRAAALTHLGSLRVLYILMENMHPKTFSLPPLQRQSLILGPQSRIFCNSAQATFEDDHDLFVTTWEQGGGLTAPFTTLFAATPTASNSTHFGVQRDLAHTAHLVTLLNAPVGGPLFTTSTPSPGSVPRINSCPMTLP